MASAVDHGTTYELHVLHAPADGVEPALLLKAPGNRAEYLFNVPDGFSRLALEHKLTPSARLSCVLLTSLLPRSTGGLGGLFLRLKHDGHGHLQVIGPRGSSSITHSLRHICRWRHPKVFVSECCDNGPLAVFEDEHIVIVPLLAGDQSSGCPWCLYASPGTPAAGQLKKETQTASAQHDSSLSSTDGSPTSSSSSDDSTGALYLQSFSEGDEVDSFEERLSGFSSFTTGKDVQPKELGAKSSVNSDPDHGDGAAANSKPHAESEAGQEAFDSKRNHSSLPQRRRRHEAFGKLRCDPDETVIRCISRELHKAWKSQSPDQSFPISHSGSSVSRIEHGVCSDGGLLLMPGGLVVPKKFSASLSSNLLRSCEGTSGYERYSETSQGKSVNSEALSESAFSARQSKAPVIHSLKGFDWLISNDLQDDLPQLAYEFNPVYSKSPSGDVTVVTGPDIEKDSMRESTGQCDSLKEKLSGLLGYVCYLKKLNKAVLVADCNSLQSLDGLKGHPVLRSISQTSGVSEHNVAHPSGEKHTLAAVLHLSPPSVVQSRDYLQWMSSLTVTATHFVMKDSSTDFGFWSSLTTLRKLNSIHPDIFPLPPSMIADPMRKPAQLNLGEKDVSVVDAELCMVLKFSERDTTFSRACMHISGSLLTVKQNSSKTQTSELLYTDVAVPKIGVSSPIQSSPNVVAAAAIKRTLLEQKRLCSSLDTSMGTRGRLSNVTTFKTNAAKFCMKEDQDERGEEVQGVSGVHPITAEVGLIEEQKVSSIREVLGPCIPTSQDIVPPDCMTLCEPDSEFKLTFLGTGSAEPSKKRGSSGILVQVKGAQGAMLLDAGEGVCGQLIRRFGKQESRSLISSLECLWLSHKHGDHALGVLSILQMRSTQASPLRIIGPLKVGQWLSEVRDTLAAARFSIPSFTYIHCEELSASRIFTSRPEHAVQLLELCDAMQLKSMKTVKVFHCYDAYGIVLNGRTGWGLVYSGDTRPSKNLIEAGRGCTLLIHEATFEDSLTEQAKQKRHSTVSEALQVGMQMHARHIILTHFSQRYPEMVAINSIQAGSVSLAFDGMVIPSRLLDPLGKLLPRIQAAFQKDVDVFPFIKTGAVSTKIAVPITMRHGQPTHALQEKRFPCLNISSSKGLTVTKHIRWSSESDEDEVKVGCLDNQALTTSIRWLSDSEEDTESFQELNHLKGVGCSSSLGTGSSKVNCKLGRASCEITSSSGSLQGEHIRWLDSDSEDG